MQPDKDAVTKQDRCLNGLGSGLRRCVAGLVFADFAPKRRETGPTTPHHIPEGVFFLLEVFVV